MELFVDDFCISPFTMCVYVAAREKGLAFKTTMVALQSNAHQKHDFLELSWSGKVPTWKDDDGFALSESLAIVEYLEERYPFPNFPRLFPADLRDRARARQILAWVGSDLPALRDERSQYTIFYEKASTPLSEKAGRDAERLLRVAARLLSDGRECLFGAWCLADTALAMMLNRLVANGDKVPEYVRSYVRRQWGERASVREFEAIMRRPYVPY